MWTSAEVQYWQKGVTEIGVTASHARSEGLECVVEQRFRALAIQFTLQLQLRNGFGPVGTTGELVRLDSIHVAAIFRKRGKCELTK